MHAFGLYAALDLATLIFGKGPEYKGALMVHPDHPAFSNAYQAIYETVDRVYGKSVSWAMILRAAHFQVNAMRPEWLEFIRTSSVAATVQKRVDPRSARFSVREEAVTHHLPVYTSAFARMDEPILRYWLADHAIRHQFSRYDKRIERQSPKVELLIKQMEDARTGHKTSIADEVRKIAHQTGKDWYTNLLIARGRHYDLSK